MQSVDILLGVSIFLASTSTAVAIAPYVERPIARFFEQPVTGYVERNLRRRLDDASRPLTDTEVRDMLKPLERVYTFSRSDGFSKNRAYLFARKILDESIKNPVLAINSEPGAGEVRPTSIRGVLDRS